jgi:phosphoribosyl 1,2-cyclic phosphate phosphodiesterase
MSLGAETTYLIHTTHTIEYDEVSRKLPDGIKLGYDGLRVQFEDYSAAR